MKTYRINHQILSLFALIPFLYALVPLTTFAQESNPYLSQWDQLDLSGSRLPVIMPYNRIIDPAGEQIYYGSPELENHALDCAISPDGKTLAIQGRYRIIFYDIETRRLIYEIIPSNEEGFLGAMNTYSGIKWFRKRERQYVLWSMVSNRTQSYVMMAEWDGHQAMLTNQYQLAAKSPSPVALPNEFEILREKTGDYLVVTLNGNDQVVKMDMNSQQIIWESAVGVAPYGIVAANGKLFVSDPR